MDWNEWAAIEWLNRDEALIWSLSDYTSVKQACADFADYVGRRTPEGATVTKNVLQTVIEGELL